MDKEPIDLFANELPTEEIPEPKTVTVDDVIIEQPKRKPGRPRKNITVDDAEGMDEPVIKPTRSRRSKKLTGADVADGVELVTSLVAMLSEGEQAHWVIPASEFKPVADGYADLLNRIPSKYVKGAFDMTGYVSMLIGTYMIVGPRIAKSQEISRTKKRLQREANEPEQAAPFEATYSGTQF